MVYVSIPYLPENNRIDKDLVKKEMEFLEIPENAKEDAIAAIYHKIPRGVDFAGKGSVEAIILENVLSKLGIPYRRLEKSDY
jgi:hypothetical protein